MDRKIAEQIVALVNSQIDQLISTLEAVEAAVSPEEFAAYKRGIAKVITTFDVEVIDRVAREHPDLKPADDDADAPGADEDAPSGRSHNWIRAAAARHGARRSFDGKPAALRLS